MIWVIIPTYNEEKAHPVTLAQLLTQGGNYQVLVVDGGSFDGTCEVVKAEPRITLLNAPKGRASQMNAGADYVKETSHATDDWLLFLHSDTFLPKGAMQRLNDMEPNSSRQAGGFLHRFSGNDWRLRLVSWLNNYRCRRTRIIYGDQALFVRRALFERLGGFPEQPILEDVAFCKKLVGQVTPLLLAPPVQTDSRKFIQMGIWRSLIRVLFIILSMEFRLPILPRAFFQDIR